MGCPILTPTVHWHCDLVENVEILSLALLCILWAVPLYLHLSPILQGEKVENVKMPFIKVLSRNVLASPGTVLPLVLSCQGRAYTPLTTSPVTPDLVGVLIFASTLLNRRHMYIEGGKKRVQISRWEGGRALQWPLWQLVPAKKKLRLSLRNLFNLSRRQSSLCPVTGLHTSVTFWKRICIGWKKFLSI